MLPKNQLGMVIEFPPAERYPNCEKRMRFSRSFFAEFSALINPLAREEPCTGPKEAGPAVAGRGKSFLEKKKEK